MGSADCDGAGVAPARLLQVPHDQLAMAAGILDEQPVGVVAARDHPGQIASGHRRRHGGFVVRRNAGDADPPARPSLLQQRGVGVVAGHGQHRVGRKHLHSRR